MSVIFSPVDWQAMMSNKLNNQFYTALHKSNFHKVRHLIVHEGVSANHQFADGSFPLHIAANHQEFEILKFLLHMRASPNYKNRHGQTSLMLSITQGSRSIEIVQALVDAGCRVNLCDEQRRTALHMAAGRALVEVMEILIAAGADVNSLSTNARTPLHVMLINLSHQRSSAIVLRNTYEAVKILLCAGARVNQGDDKHATPLFLTVAGGDQWADIFTLLVANGANPDQRSRHKLTPFMLAVMKGHQTMCRLLVEQNVDVNGSNPVQHRSGLYLAVSKGFLQAAKCIVEGGADLYKEMWLYNGAYSKFVQPDTEMAAWLKKLTEQPQSLRHLCRTRIRKCIGVSIVRKLKKLQYPELLKQVILLRDEDSRVNMS